jgi:hypothetical protein
LNEIGHQISDKLTKQNYPILANNFMAQKLSQEEIFKTIFKEVEDLINKFNEEVTILLFSVKPLKKKHQLLPLLLFHSMQKIKIKRRIRDNSKKLSITTMKSVNFMES